MGSDFLKKYALRIRASEYPHSVGIINGHAIVTLRAFISLRGDKYINVPVHFTDCIVKYTDTIFLAGDSAYMVFNPEELWEKATMVAGVSEIDEINSISFSFYVPGQATNDYESVCTLIPTIFINNAVVKLAIYYGRDSGKAKNVFLEATCHPKYYGELIVKKEKGGQLKFSKWASDMVLKSEVNEDIITRLSKKEYV